MYHIIFVCKYRKQFLIGEIEHDMKKIMRHMSEMSDFDIEVMETDKDHLHMMVRSKLKLSPLQIVRRLKQMSTSAVWKKYGDFLRQNFYKEHTLGTDGYFVSSIGNVCQETIKKYIENQGWLCYPAFFIP